MAVVGVLFSVIRYPFSVCKYFVSLLKLNWSIALALGSGECLKNRNQLQCVVSECVCGVWKRII